MQMKDGVFTNHCTVLHAGPPVEVRPLWPGREWLQARLEITQS
jgi:hypothetical protein